MGIINDTPWKVTQLCGLIVKDMTKAKAEEAIRLLTDILQVTHAEPMPGLLKAGHKFDPYIRGRMWCDYDANIYDDSHLDKDCMGPHWVIAISDLTADTGNSVFERQTIQAWSVEDHRHAIDEYVWCDFYGAVHENTSDPDREGPQEVGREDKFYENNPGWTKEVREHEYGNQELWFFTCPGPHKELQVKDRDDHTGNDQRGHP